MTCEQLDAEITAMTVDMTEEYDAARVRAINAERSEKGCL